MTGIQYSNKLIKSLRECVLAHSLPTLRDEVEKVRKKQQKTETPDPNLGVYVEFVNAPGTKCFLDSEFTSAPREVVLAPFIFEPNLEPALWVAFSARFDYDRLGKKDYMLTALGLTLARGNQDLRCMVRAEWDARTDALRSGTNHAQPHWHSHALRPAAEMGDPVEHRWAKIQGGVHLAMGTTWGYQPGRAAIHCNPLDESVDPAAWLDHCLRYIRDQFAAEVHTNPLDMTAVPRRDTPF